MMPGGYDLHSRQVFFGMPDVPNKADVQQSLPGGIQAEQLSQEVRLCPGQHHSGIHHVANEVADARVENAFILALSQGTSWLQKHWCLRHVQLYVQ